MGFKIRVNLVILDIKEFDIILLMSLFSSYHAILNCFAKTITIAMLEKVKLKLESTFNPNPTRVLSIIHALKLVKKSCQAFLAHFRKLIL